MKRFLNVCADVSDDEAMVFHAVIPGTGGNSGVTIYLPVLSADKELREDP